MRAGKLRHRVTIQQPVETQDSYGEPIITWTALDTVWGAVEPLRGGESYTRNDAQLLAEADYRIRLRHRSDVTHKMRVVWGTRVFQINHVADVMERQRELHLMCEEQP